MRRVVFTFLILIFSLSAFANSNSTETTLDKSTVVTEELEPLSTAKPKPFTRWKEQQVVDAKNKVVRLSNLLLLIKSEKHLPENVLPQVAKENKQEIDIPENQQKELIKHTESQLKEAVASLEFVRELNLNDYFSVYLQQFKNQPEALMALASDMDKAEVAEILLSIINSNKSIVMVKTPIMSVPTEVKEAVKSSKVSAKRTPSEL